MTRTQTIDASTTVWTESGESIFDVLESKENRILEIEALIQKVHEGAYFL